MTFCLVSQALWGTDRPSSISAFCHQMAHWPAALQSRLLSKPPDLHREQEGNSHVRNLKAPGARAFTRIFKLIPQTSLPTIDYCSHRRQGKLRPRKSATKLIPGLQGSIFQRHISTWLKNTEHQFSPHFSGSYNSCLFPESKSLDMSSSCPQNPAPELSGGKSHPKSE